MMYRIIRRAGTGMINLRITHSLTVVMKRYHVLVSKLDVRCPYLCRWDI